MNEVRAEGLEPPRLTALAPKTSASTNSATPAFFKMDRECSAIGHADIFGAPCPNGLAALHVERDPGAPTARVAAGRGGSPADRVRQHDRCPGQAQPGAVQLL